MDEKKEYKNILKITSIFGYVQLVTLVSGIIRSKIAAFWLGAQGVGILGLLTSSISLIISLTSFGLPTSIIKLLSKEKSEDELSKKIYILNKILLVLGILGSLLLFLFAHHLSILTFNTADFTWAFRLLSISVLCRQFYLGYSSIFQATYKLKLLANVNAIASLIGILVTIPLYYFFKINGIFYNFLAVAIIEFVIVMIAFNQANYVKVIVNRSEIIKEAKPILKSSVTFSFTGFITLLSAYLVQIYISKEGSIQDVGIYVAAYTILNSYVGLIFIVMGNEYFPRIAQHNEDKNYLNTNVNRQLYLGTLLVLPLLMFLILLAPIVVRVLYSVGFEGSVEFVKIASIGLFFKVFSWTLGYVILVKGSNRFIILNSLFYNSVFLTMHLIGFYFWGLLGVSIAFSIYYLIHFLGNLYSISKRFEFNINNQNVKYFLIFGLLILMNILISFFVESVITKNILIGITTVFISAWSFSRLIKMYK